MAKSRTFLRRVGALDAPDSGGFRARARQKRGGDEAIFVSLSNALDTPTERPLDLVALDDALVTLARLDARQSHIIELRFFGGLSVEETAEVLGVSPNTVMGDWRTARAWLHRELSPR